MVPEFLESYRPEGDVLEFDDDSDKEFFENPSNAGSDDGFAGASDTGADAEAEAGSAAAEPAEAEESDKVVARDAEDANKEPADDDEPIVAKRTVPRPTVTSEEEEDYSIRGKPVSHSSEHKKGIEEEAKREKKKAGLGSSQWAPKEPAPKNEDSFWF